MKFRNVHVCKIGIEEHTMTFPQLASETQSMIFSIQNHQQHLNPQHRGILEDLALCGSANGNTWFSCVKDV